MPQKLRFIDLFAGIGGFHVALERIGHQCVFACEIDNVLREIYLKNFGIEPAGDIRRIKVADIPEHDILCAGFPCQPFSKAGDQLGLNCPKDGDLFSYVVKILKQHKPRYFFLENVPNLLRHEKGGTYAKMKKRLLDLGYDVKETLFSPHHFGIPQIRERAYIVGSLKPLKNFVWPKESRSRRTIKSVLNSPGSSKAKSLSPEAISVIKTWQRFLKRCPQSVELPSFPIWSNEFGANYPYETETPYSIGERRLAKFKGSHGKRLSRLPIRARLKALPSYAQTEEEKFPKWKIDFIRQNREFYKKNKRWIDEWLPAIKKFPPSWQKLEWNCNGEERDIWRYILQFRASGIRVKRPSTAPSLVAMTISQVPIVGWQRRYMTPRECAKLQSLGSIKLPEAQTRAFKALGNAVNASVVEKVVKSVLKKPRRKKSQRSSN